MTTTTQTILEKYRGRGRDVLLPLLWEMQTEQGHINAEDVHNISHAIRVPEADIYGVIEFYTLFHHTPTHERIVRVCTDPTCSLADADELLHRLHKHTDTVTVEHTTCIGMCDHAPSALISRRKQGEMLIPKAHLDDLLNTEKPPFYQTHTKSQTPILLAPVDDDYVALERALKTLTPTELIDAVTASGLIGRGGAAFPTGMKWRFTRQALAEIRYVVCNADESEPGTFKDRLLMEVYPQRVLEGLALASYAVGAQQAYIFIRGEYPGAYHALRDAYERARGLGIFGKNMMGTGHSLHIEIQRGAGAYICGEETALFEAMEGKRGFPRIKPPYPTTYGLWGQPTAVNNVETLCNIPYIVLSGADSFRQHGTQHSTGTKLLSVSGHVHHPGVYEIIPGLTLGELLEDMCGGIVGELQAVLIGGAAGTFLTPDELDVRLTFEDLRTIEASFGSGAILVFNSSVNLRDILHRLAKFFQHESCGKCLPCQLGTQRQLEVIERLPAPLEDDNTRLYDIGMTMTDSSLCGLGQTASSAILSAMKKFPHLFSMKA